MSYKASGPVREMILMRHQGCGRQYRWLWFSAAAAIVLLFSSITGCGINSDNERFQLVLLGIPTAQLVW